MVALNPVTDELGSKDKVEKLTTTKAFILALHQIGFTPAQCEEFLDSRYDIERVGTIVAFRPPVVWSDQAPLALRASMNTMASLKMVLGANMGRTRKYCVLLKRPANPEIAIVV